MVSPIPLDHSIPSPACGGGSGWGDAKHGMKRRALCIRRGSSIDIARLRPHPHPPPRAGEGVLVQLINVSVDTFTQPACRLTQRAVEQSHWLGRAALNSKHPGRRAARMPLALQDLWPRATALRRDAEYVLLRRAGEQ